MCPFHFSKYFLSRSFSFAGGTLALWLGGASLEETDVALGKVGMVALVEIGLTPAVSASVRPPGTCNSDLQDKNTQEFEKKDGNQTILIVEITLLLWCTFVHNK